MSDFSAFVLIAVASLAVSTIHLILINMCFALSFVMNTFKRRKLISYPRISCCSFSIPSAHSFFWLRIGCRLWNFQKKWSEYCIQHQRGCVDCPLDKVVASDCQGGKVVNEDSN